MSFRNYTAAVFPPENYAQYLLRRFYILIVNSFEYNLFYMHLDSDCRR
jgi:hypothetical protein